MLAGAEPELVPSVSHVEVLLAVHPRFPDPRLEIVTFCADGLNPAAPKKVSDAGPADSTAVFTARVTGITSGELLAPGA